MMWKFIEIKIETFQMTLIVLKTNNVLLKILWMKVPIQSTGKFKFSKIYLLIL